MFVLRLFKSAIESLESHICQLRLPRCTILLKSGDSRYTVERWGWHGLLDRSTLLVRRVGILRCITRADDNRIGHGNAISRLGPITHRVVVALDVVWMISSISLSWVGGSLGRV